MRSILHILFFVFIVAVTSVPCDKSDPSSLCLSKIRHSAHRNRNLDSGNQSDVNASIRRRGGGGGGRGGRTGSTGGSVGTGGSGGSGGESGDGAECFPGSSLVYVRGKGVIKMSELQIGDSVQTAQGFSPVYMFSHRIKSGQFNFVKLVTDSGDLSVTEGHYVYARDRLVTAGSLQIGDELEREDGRVAKIVGKEMIRDIGLYNPHSINGELVVNGMRVSVYTKAVDPTFANCILSPIRAAFRIVGIDVTGGLLNSDISDTVISALPRGRMINSM